MSKFESKFHGKFDPRFTSKFFGGGQAIGSTRTAVAHVILSNNQVLESATSGTAVGTFTSVLTTGTPQWTLSNDAGGKFAVDINTGVLTTVGALDFEATPSYNITVHVTGLTPSLSDTPFVIVVLNVVEDTTPAAFTLGSQSSAVRSTVYTSSTVTITGVDGASDVVITGTATSKEYSINGGAWVSSAVTGSITSGQTLAVRGTSSGSYSTALTVIATVGGNVTSATADTFTITTMTDPLGSGYVPTYYILGF